MCCDKPSFFIIESKGINTTNKSLYVYLQIKHLESMHFIVRPFSALITMEKQINCGFYTHKYITIGSIALNIVPLVDSSILPNRYYFFRLDHKVCVKKPLQVSNWTITETSLFTAWTIFSFTVSVRKRSFKLIDLLKS